MITNGEIVNRALDFLAVNGVLTSASPDTNSKFLRFLVMMLTSWTNESIHIGFKIPDDPTYPDASDESGIAIDDLSAVAMNLGVYGATSIGIMVPPRLSAAAQRAKRNLYSKEIPEVEPNTDLYMGSGRKQVRPFQTEDSYIDVENNGQLGDLTE